MDGGPVRSDPPYPPLAVRRARLARERGGRLRLPRRPAPSRVLDPATDLLVALAARFGAEVVADGEAGKKSNTESHVELCTARAAARTHLVVRRTHVRYHARRRTSPAGLRGGREPAAMGYRGKIKEQEQAR